MESTNKVNELQLLQHNLQNSALQKQQIQQQIIEFDSALKELENTPQAYKIVGKIMLATSKEELSKDLKEKKEVAELRMKSFTQNEEKLQQKMEELQKEVMAEMKTEKK